MQRVHNMQRVKTERFESAVIDYQLNRMDKPNR